MQLQSGTSIKPCDWVYPGDPALDQKAKDFESEYEAAHDSADFARLPRKNGQEPAVFVIAPLRGRALRLVCTMSRADSVEVRARGIYLAVAFALEGVRHLFDAEGEEVEIERLPDPKLERLSRVTDEQMDALCEFDNGMLVTALGIAVVERSYSKKN